MNVCAFINKQNPEYTFKLGDFTVHEGKIIEWNLEMKQPTQEELEAITTEEISDIKPVKKITSNLMLCSGELCCQKLADEGSLIYCCCCSELKLFIGGTWKII